MKNTGLAIIAIIGFYTFGRNNLGLLPPGQVMWVSHPDIFYKVFIPLLMFGSAVTAILNKGKINILYLSFMAMFIDAINRFATLVNYYYMYLTYDQSTNIEPAAGTIVVKTNYIPSFIMLLIEIILIVCVFKYTHIYRKLNRI